MKKSILIYLLSFISIIAASHAMAQEAAPATAVPVSAEHSSGFMDVVLSGGILGLLNWAGIFLWAALTLPLGVLSILHCATITRNQYPLATKLIILGLVWLFILGWVGVAQGTIGAFSILASGAPDVTVLAHCLGQALYSIAGALAVCQFYMFFLLISIVIMHFKQKSFNERAE